MATLILVDVDNLLPYNFSRSVGQQVVTECLQTLGPGWPLVPKDHRCVVICALNTVSVRTRRLNLGDLRMLAQRLAQRCIHGAKVVAVEVLLVLNMPETADGALLRAIRWAADASGSIQIHEVLLISSDKNLHRAIPGTKRSMNEGKVCHSHLKTPILRELLSPRTSVEKIPQVSGWIALNSASLAGAAATLPPQQSPKTLVDLANLVERYPAYLSQFGPTLRSHRGAARLLILDNKPTTLACHEDEALEYCGTPPEPPQPGEGEISPSSIGHGVAVLSTSSSRYVLRTSLPGHLLRATYPLSQRRILDNHLPDEHLLGVGHEAQTGIKTGLLFSVIPSPDRIRCVMENIEEGADPPSWWVFQKRGQERQNLSTTVKYQAPAPLTNIVARDKIPKVVGNLVPVEIGGQVELVCRSPLRTGEVVELRKNAAQKELVPASNTAVEGGEPCAFLALGRSWRKGHEVAAVAIQHAEDHLLRAHGLSDTEILHLRRLPIIIPLQILGDLAKKRPGAS